MSHPRFTFLLLVAVVLLGGCTLSTTTPTSLIESTTSTAVLTTTLPEPRVTLTPLPTQSKAPAPTATLEVLPFTLNELDAGEYLVYWEQGKNQYALFNPIDLSSQQLMVADSPRAWLSPDGRRIAYYMQGQIQVYDLDTGVISPIPQPNIFTAANLPFAGLTWSPDGKMIAFAASTIQISEEGVVVETEDLPSIWVSFLDENRFNRLTWHLIMEASPAWSPDGRWLAFASDHDKVEWAQANQVQADFSGDTDIYVLDTTCLEQPDECLGKAQRITGGNFLEENGSRPTWSPDSAHIVYECGIQEHVDNSELTSYQTDICMVDVDGNQINLTNTPDERESLPTWSPDGTAIAFMRQHQYSADDIFWLDLVSGEIVNVTNSPEVEETSFLWSSDGKSIVFSLEESAGIFMTSLDDGTIMQLTDTGDEPVFWLVVK